MRNVLGYVKRRRNKAMKFITDKGKIEDGTPLTDAQYLQRTMLVPYFHAIACRDTYHSYSSSKQCEELATAFVTGEIEAAANKKTEPVEPEVPELEVVEPITATVQLPDPEQWKPMDMSAEEAALGPF
jgi:hypothetical protein